MSHRRIFKVLVCGGRGYKVWIDIFNTIKTLHEKYKVTHLLNGGATGCDSYATDVAKELGIQPVVCDAIWNFYGKPAGPIRNKNMLDLNPDLVIAFPGGDGTEGMVKLAKEAGIEVIRFSDLPSSPAKVQ